MKGKKILFVTLAVIVTVLSGFFILLPDSESKTNEESAAAVNNEYQNAEEYDGLLEIASSLFSPLPEVIKGPADNPVTDEKVKLGRKLFHDPRLSVSGVISCNTCHNLAMYGSDNVEASIGHGFQVGVRNSPTVFNAGLHIAQFWDGRDATLEEQAKGPVLNPIEMAMPDEMLIIDRLRSIPGYSDLFNDAFEDEAETISFDNYAKAVAAFQRTLTTPSRFDDYLKGDIEALDEQEKRGLRTFIDKGCTACHSGPALGGEMFQKFGLFEPYKNENDLGRYEVTGEESDKFVFKVPSLRNINRTYPYFHDGAVWDIREAVSIMGRTQLGIELSEGEIEDIVVFFDSLTGDIPEHALRLPVLPPSTPDTPRPGIE